MTGGGRTRVVQVAFVVLLVVSCAQVVWWVIDQYRLGATIERQRLEGYEGDRRAAEQLLSRGADVDELRRAFPDLVFGRQAGETSVEVAPALVAAVADDRRRHGRQYGWESAFFLAVLLACIGVLWRGLREEARLRRRHENFLASVSHELRSPLSSLRLQTETLQRRELPPERRGALLERSVRDLNRLEGLVENVLEAARLDAGDAREVLGWQAEPVDVRDAVARQIADLEEGRSAAVVNAVGEGVTALADRRAFDVILRNLLANAARAIESGGEVVVSGEARDGEVAVRVKDTGIGFEQEEGALLFDKFYRPGSALRSGSGGTGLGLYIVRQLAEVGGGRVSARSDGPGRGAVFEVVFPAIGASA